METMAAVTFNRNGDDLMTLLSELLEDDRTRLLAEIGHTFHRIYRDQLRRRPSTPKAGPSNSSARSGL